eukprot:1965172-Rhodomonas_salina.2
MATLLGFVLGRVVKDLARAAVVVLVGEIHCHVPTHRLAVLAIRGHYHRGKCSGIAQRVPAKDHDFDGEMLSFASGAPDPWERFPQLRTMCEGLKKQVGTPASRKEGVTINIFKAVFEFWDLSEKTYRAAGNSCLADNALLNATQLCFGFFGLRRASELFVSASGHMGLRIWDVDVVEGSHVALFIRKQKNDPYSKG